VATTSGLLPRFHDPPLAFLRSGQVYSKAQVYRTPDRRIAWVPYTSSATNFSFGEPSLWPDGRVTDHGPNAILDVSPDGKRLGYAEVGPPWVEPRGPPRALPLALLAAFRLGGHCRNLDPSTLQVHASRRSLRTSRAVSEVPPHL